MGADTETLAGSLKDTADSLGASTDSLAANLATAEASLRKTAETLRTAESQLAQARDDLQHALDTGDIDEVRRHIGDNPAAIAQLLAAPTHLERRAVYPHGRQRQRHEPLLHLPRSVDRRHLHGGPHERDRFPRAPGRPGEEVRARAAAGRAVSRPIRGVLPDSLAQALIVGLGNVFFLGVECEHFWLYLAACCLASVVFTNLVYTLTVSFGNIGKALAIIGLVLQLAGRRRPHAGADAVGPAVPGDLPVAALRPFHAGAGRGHGRHLRRPVPRADGLLAAILVPSLILGLVLRRPVIRLNRWVLAKLDGTKFL